MKKIAKIIGSLVLLMASSGFAVDGFDLIHRSNLQGLKKFLEENPGNYDLKNSKQESLLVAAAQSGEVEILKFLAKKMDINQKDGSGRTALFAAVNNSQEKAAIALIDLKADLKIHYQGFQENILHTASRVGTLKVISALISKDPDLLHEKNKLGETPLFDAVKASQSRVARELLDAGAKKDVKNNKNKTVMDLIDASSDKKLVRLFRGRE